jgi:hypothetical protein
MQQRVEAQCLGRIEKGLEVVVCMRGMRIELPQEKPEKWW